MTQRGTYISHRNTNTGNTETVVGSKTVFTVRVGYCYWGIWRTKHDKCSTEMKRGPVETESPYPLHRSNEENNGNEFSLTTSVDKRKTKAARDGQFITRDRIGQWANRSVVVDQRKPI